MNSDSSARDAAQAVTGADLRTLRALISEALVDRDPSGHMERGAQPTAHLARDELPHPQRHR